MSAWVRLWEDMPTDPKWRVIARRSGRPISEVIAVFVFMLTNAGSAQDRGSLQNWNDEDVAAALDLDPENVEAIREAMQGRTLDGDHLTGWERRQPKREDGAAERAKAWREAQRTHPNASERTETKPNATEPPEEKREDTEKKESSSLRSEDKRTREVATEFADEFWQAWPNKVGRPAALKSFERARKTHDLETIMAGLRTYVRDKPPDRSWLNPATFLNQERFLDLPAGVSAAKPPQPKQNPFFAVIRESYAGQTHERPDDNIAILDAIPDQSAHGFGAVEHDQRLRPDGDGLVDPFGPRAHFRTA